MTEQNLKYLKKSDFGGMRSRRGKRKPNQLYVYDIAIQCFDFPRGPHFNQLPAQLILEIFKYLWAYELLRKVSLVCKYWYNLCRDRTLWTSITWNGRPRTLGHLLQLTKYQVHVLVLTDNIFTFSDKALALLLKKCTHLKCLKLPRNACRELFQRELPKTNILGGSALTDLFSLFSENEPLAFPCFFDSQYEPLTDLFSLFSENEPFTLRRRFLYYKERLRRFGSYNERLRRFGSYNEHFFLLYIYANCIEMALSSVEHKRFLTPGEFLSQYRKGNRFSQHPDKTFYIELKSLECVLQRDRVSRSVRMYETATKSPKQSCFRNIPFQDCRMDRRQQQPCKIKPRAPKGRSNQHKEIRKFRRLQKRFKIYSLK